MNTRPTPQEFCADCYPWPTVAQLADGTDITACYLVCEQQRKATKQDKLYLRLVLADRTGSVDGVIGEDAEALEPFCGPEEIVGVRGRVGRYQNKLQLTIREVEPLRIRSADLEHFLAASPRDHTAMCKELDALIRSVEDLALCTLLRRCLGPGTALGQAFRVHPAAKRNHHAYVGGLLEHSLSVANSCDRLADHYRSQGAEIDRDLLVAGALLHDIGKVRELTGGPSIGYTAEGSLLGHIVIGINLVTREAEAITGLARDRILLLQHLIASHQGKPEWESPKAPQTVEALILHYADDLDAKLNPVMRMLDGVEPGDWSEYDGIAGRKWYRTAGLPETAEVEPVHPTEVINIMFDLFPR